MTRLDDQLLYLADAWHMVDFGEPLLAERPQVAARGVALPSRALMVLDWGPEGEFARMDLLLVVFGFYATPDLDDVLRHIEVAPWCRASLGEPVDPVATRNYYAMQRAKGEPTPPRVRPPSEWLERTTHERVFRDHAALFAALAE